MKNQYKKLTAFLYTSTKQKTNLKQITENIEKKIPRDKSNKRFT